MLCSKQEFKEKCDTLQELYVQLQCLGEDKESDKSIAEEIIQKMIVLLHALQENAAIHSELYIPHQRLLKKIQQFAEDEKIYYSLSVQSSLPTLPEYQLEYQASDEAQLKNLRELLNAHCSFLRCRPPFYDIDFDFSLSPNRNTLLFTGNIHQAKQVLNNLGYLGEPDRLKETVQQDEPPHLLRHNFSA